MDKLAVIWLLLITEYFQHNCIYTHTHIHSQAWQVSPLGPGLLVWCWVFLHTPIPAAPLRGLQRGRGWNLSWSLGQAVTEGLQQYVSAGPACHPAGPEQASPSLHVYDLSSFQGSWHSWLEQVLWFAHQHWPAASLAPWAVALTQDRIINISTTETFY